MTNDNHRDAAYTYNHLNLPERVDLDGGTEWVTYTYTASGEKLERHDHTGTTRTYCRGVEYAGASIDVIYQAEGRAVPDGGGYAYEYVLRDHLGNNRVWFTDQDGDNEVTEAEIIQQNHYYPFGMEQEGNWNQGSDAYRYNGKELDEATGLYDYGARYYDPAIARWGQIDPLADQYAAYSPYNYVLGNPISLIDPDGMRVSLFDRMEAMGANHGSTAEESMLKQFNSTLLNLADFGTAQLLDITNIASDIFAKNGFEGILNFSIILGKEAREYKNGYAGENELFLALVDEDERTSYYGKDPGHSRLSVGGYVEAWSGNHYSSYVNAGILKSKFGYGDDWNYAIDYTVAHELNHQILQKADLSINGRSPYKTEYDGHTNSYANLNSTGSLKITKDALKNGREACTGCFIRIRQKILIQRYRLSNR